MAIDDELNTLERMVFRLLTGLIVGKMFFFGFLMLLMTLTPRSTHLTHLTISGSSTSWHLLLMQFLNLFDVVRRSWFFIPIGLAVYIVGYIAGFRIGRDIWLCQRKYLMLTIFLLTAQLLIAGPALLWFYDSKDVQKILISCGVILLVPVFIKYLLVPIFKICLLKQQEAVRLNSENSNIPE
ncbi:hypothetical protein [Rubinisphaera italica]|nr:hypothetical protein [Rubinisphaera italica]